MPFAAFHGVVYHDTTPITDTWGRIVLTVAGTIPAAGVRLFMALSIHSKIS